MMADSFTSMGAGHDANQDSHSIMTGGKVHAMIVCDGHGDEGEVVSGAMARIVPAEVLAAVVDDPGAFRAGASDSKAVAAIQRALKSVDEKAAYAMKSAGESGCTVAGFFYHTESRVAYLYTVGDSMVAAVKPDGTFVALPLQNASNMPGNIMKAALELQWATGDAYVGNAPDDGPGYMLFPGKSRGGMQMYSCIGDFDLKGVNPLVSVYPVVKKVSGVPAGTVFLVTSDGYLDGLKGEPMSRSWCESIKRELFSGGRKARALEAMARSRGSEDDITVLVYTAA